MEGFLVRKNKQTKKCRECGKNKSINKFKKNQKTKDKHVSVCNDCISEKSAKTRKTKIYTDFYIYRFLDKDNNIIYVGKTTNIDSRVCGHIGIANSLSQTENQFLMYQNIYRIEYSKVESDYHMNLYEIHYICKYNPPFNTDYKSNNKNVFDFPELTWNTYIFKSFIDNIQMHYLMKYGEDAINIKEKLYSDNEFYNEIVNDFNSSKFTYLQFNPDEYSIKECLSDDDFDKIDELDYCKNDDDCNVGNDEECEHCKNKTTWREYYNDKIKESKIKFNNVEECI